MRENKQFNRYGFLFPSPIIDIWKQLQFEAKRVAKTILTDLPPYYRIERQNGQKSEEYIT